MTTRISGSLGTFVQGPGYHISPIKKGELGELSKVQEELDELRDAEAQGIKVMQLLEASDLIGALVRWLERHHEGTTLEDLIEMHKVTRRAFDNGRRVSHEPVPVPVVGLKDPPVTLGQRWEVCGSRYGGHCTYTLGHGGKCSDDRAHP